MNDLGALPDNPKSRTKVPHGQRTKNQQLYATMIGMFKSQYGITQAMLGEKLHIGKNTIKDRVDGNIMVRDESIFALMYIKNELGMGVSWEDIE